MKRGIFHLLIKEHFAHEKMAFIVGPRQVGKTYLAKQLLEERHSSDLYRNWDDIEWRKELVRKPYNFIDSYRPKTGKTKPLAVMDEIHKFPRWKRYVKGLWDTRKEKIDLMITGSGRLDVYQRGGDSLFGRYHQYRLHPLSVAEIVNPNYDLKNYTAELIVENLANIQGRADTNIEKTYKELFKWGGFPKPFIERDERELALWHKERKQLLIREDLRDMTRIQLLSHVEELVEILSDRAGGILSYNSIREDMQVALESVRLWTDYLQRLYYIYLVRPYSKKIARAIKREPKVYLWDWSEIQEEGAKFENMIASHLLKWCHFTQDWGLEPLELHFIRDKEKREVDFLVTKNKTPWLLIETKLSEKEPTPAIHYFADKLGIKNKFLIVSNLAMPGTVKDVHIIDAPNFLACLPV